MSAHRSLGMTLRPRTLWLALIVVALVVGAWMVTRNRATAVDVITAGAQTFQPSVVASGRVLAPAQVDIGSTITGRVTAIGAREGERVRAGALLIELDTLELAAAVRQAEAALNTAQARVRGVSSLSVPTAKESVAQAEAALLNAEREQQRTRELAQKGFFSQSKVDEADRQATVAKSQVAAARAQLAAQLPDGAEAQQARTRLAEAREALATARAKLAQARITSPADAVVLNRDAEIGDIAQPGKKLMSLAVAGATRLTVQIDEKNMPLLTPGTKVAAVADPYPEQRFEAVLSYVSPGVDATRGTVEVRFDVPNPPPFLKSDMTVAVEITGPALANTIVLPLQVIRDASSTTPYVLVAKEGAATRAPVTLGLQTQGRAVVRSGVATGDRVIVNKDVSEGQSVRVASGNAKAN